MKNIEQKIAIIGAGISGLKAAHTLKKLGYSNITIYEAADQVGGKIRSYKRDGYIYELGAIFIPRGSTTIENLVKEYDYSLTKYKRNVFFYSRGKQVSHLRCLLNNTGFIELMKCLFHVLGFTFKFIKYMKCIKEPGFTKLDPDLYRDFQSFLDENRAGPFAEITEPLSYVYCYGYLNSTPTFYYLKLFQIGIIFFVKDVLNSSLGFNFKLLPIFDKGYQSLLVEMAGEFSVKLNARVSQITRENTGGSFKIHITANGETGVFDRVIISSMPYDTLKFLDAGDEERLLFSRIKYWYYEETLVYGEFDLEGAGLILEKGYHKGRKGFPSVVSNFNKENNIYQIYQMHDGSLFRDELLQMVYELAELLGGRIDDVILSLRIPYFPHYVEKDLIELDPFKKIEKMQGEMGTYYIGSLMNFEGSNWSAEYADQLIRKHF